MRGQRLTVVCSTAAVTAALLVAAPVDAASTAPRIVKARLVDSDGNQTADRVVLTYSTKIRHRADRDGRYPFTVKGYKIKAVKAARKTTKLVILLHEKARSDAGARPSISYSRTKRQPVTDLRGRQAIRQVFKKTRTFRLAAPSEEERSLTVSSTLNGRVVSTPEGIDCNPLCYAIFPKDSLVTLTAHPDETVEGATFEGWSGACTGTAATCVVAMSDHQSVHASFVVNEPDEAPEDPDPLPVPLPSPSLSLPVLEV